MSTACEPCRFPESGSETVVISDKALRYTDKDCGMKQRVAAADGEVFQCGTPVAIDPATGIASANLAADSAGLWGISLVNKAASTGDNMILIIRDGVVCWADIAEAIGADASDPAVYWPIASAFRKIGIFVELM